MMSKSGLFVYFLCASFQVRVFSESDAPCETKGDEKFNISATSYITDGCVTIDVIFQSTLKEAPAYFACLCMECNCSECYQHTEAPKDEVSFKLCEHGFKTYCIMANPECSDVYYKSGVFKLPDITSDENPSVIIIAPTVLASLLLLALLVAAFFFIRIRKARKYPMKLKKKDRATFGPMENVETKVEKLQNITLSENKQGNRKRVLVAFLSDSATVATTVNHFLSLLHKFPSLEVLTLEDIYYHEQGILGLSLAAESSDNPLNQELGILISSHIEAVMLILTETIINIWTSDADYHFLTMHTDDKKLKTLVALCHYIRRNDQMMTIAVSYDFLNEDSLKMKTFRTLNKSIKVFKIIVYSAQLGFQLNVDAIHQMLQYLCDPNYRSLLTWKESMDAKLLLENIAKEEMVSCKQNSARERQCPIHRQLSDIDACQINNFSLECRERNEVYRIPQVDRQMMQRDQTKDTCVDRGSNVCHGLISGDLHHVASEVLSNGSSNRRTAFAKIHCDATNSCLHEQFCPSSSYRSNILDINSESKEAAHRYTQKELDNENIMIISNHHKNGLTILDDSSLNERRLNLLNPNGGNFGFKGIFKETRRKSTDSMDNKQADNRVNTAYLKLDELALYDDFIPPAELDEVYVETTNKALMEEIALFNKISG